MILHLVYVITIESCVSFSFYPSTFGMVDSEETCLVVMVYNTADSWGVLIGDTVVVPEPQVKRHSITHNDKVSVRRKLHRLLVYDRPAETTDVHSIHPSPCAYCLMSF